MGTGTGMGMGTGMRSWMSFCAHACRTRSRDRPLETRRPQKHNLQSTMPKIFLLKCATTCTPRYCTAKARWGAFMKGPCENEACGCAKTAGWSRVEGKVVCKHCRYYHFKYQRFPDAPGEGVVGTTGGK